MSVGDVVDGRETTQGIWGTDGDIRTRERQHGWRKVVHGRDSVLEGRKMIRRKIGEAWWRSECLWL